MEIWKDIYFEEDGIVYDYKGLYKVSNKGNVKSLNRISLQGHIIKEKILKQKTEKYGYKRVHLCDKKGSKKLLSVHRLVAHMFLSETYFEGAIVNHKDENPSNNCVENLEWCTTLYNNIYGNRLQKCREALSGEKHPSHKLIGQYDNDMNLLKIWNGTREIERELKIPHGNISKCCKFWEMSCNKEKWFKKYNKNPQKTCGGYIFKYIEGDKNE